jgi:hypothetical protein
VVGAVFIIQTNYKPHPRAAAMSRFASKNLFSNAAIAGTPYKSILNIQEPTLPPIPTMIYEQLQDVEKSYTLHLSLKQYMKIQRDINNYLKLLFSLTSYRNSVTTDYMKLLMLIAEEALHGTYNVAILFQQNLGLQLKVELLQKKIEEILSNKNNRTAMTNSTSTLAVSKTFKFSPLYSCYIYMYGLPAYGVGFEPEKLKLVMNIFDEVGMSYVV